MKFKIVAVVALLMGFAPLSQACSTFDLVCKAREAAAKAAAEAEAAAKAAAAAFNTAMNATKGALQAEGMQALSDTQNLADPDLWMTAYTATALPRVATYSVPDAADAAHAAIDEFLGAPTVVDPFGAAAGGKKLWSITQTVMANWGKAGSSLEAFNPTRTSIVSSAAYGPQLKAILPFAVPDGAYFSWSVGTKVVADEIAIPIPTSLGLMEAKQNTAVTFPLVWGGASTVNNALEKYNADRVNFSVSALVGVGTKNPIGALATKLASAVEVTFNISCAVTRSSCQLRYISLAIPKLEVKKSMKASAVTALKSLKTTLSNPLAKYSPALLPVLDGAIATSGALVNFQSQAFGAPNSTAANTVKTSVITNSKAMTVASSSASKLNAANASKWALTTDWLAVNEVSLQLFWYNDDDAAGLFTRGWTKKTPKVDMIVLSDTAKVYYEAKLSTRVAPASLAASFQAPAGATIGVQFPMTDNGRKVKEKLSDYAISVTGD
ncbi:hypothetical protein [Uliginosibacterium gangwonense]|uniref:hypothetical protein n=1 Tax=Uliginosibacterium gangwonense TaxID=392736 RepID=UPI00036E158D|nr:hypothetical protein [Uliginosibacterium gangwonense]